MGPVTPTKIVAYGLLIVGLGLLLAGRVIDGAGGSFWTGVALILIGVSSLVDGLLPGGSELTDEQVVMLKHMRVPYRPGSERVLSILFGVAVSGIGLWVMYG